MPRGGTRETLWMGCFRHYSHYWGWRETKDTTHSNSSRFPIAEGHLKVM